MIIYLNCNMYLLSDWNTWSSGIVTRTKAYPPTLGIFIQITPDSNRSAISLQCSSYTGTLRVSCNLMRSCCCTDSDVKDQGISAGLLQLLIRQFCRNQLRFRSEGDVLLITMHRRGSSISRGNLSNHHFSWRLYTPNTTVNFKNYRDLRFLPGFSF